LTSSFGKALEVGIEATVGGQARGRLLGIGAVSGSLRLSFCEGLELVPGGSGMAGGDEGIGAWIISRYKFGASAVWSRDLVQYGCLVFTSTAFLKRQLIQNTACYIFVK
jgi:hypothetical protein